jgi:MFS family permease
MEKNIQQSSHAQHPCSWDSRLVSSDGGILDVSCANRISHTIAFEQLLPVFFSMPESNQEPVLPFKFSGGFALSTKTIGLILSCQGFLQMIVQLFLFPVINRRYGSLRTFRYVVMGYPLLYFLVPYLSLVPQTLRYPAIFFILVWKVTAQSLSYPSTAIMLVNAAPSKKVLGTLNGIAASSASLARTIGPIMAGVLQAAGLRMGYAGLSWWSCGGVAVIGAIVSLWQEETKRSTQAEVQSHDVADEEEMLGEALYRHGVMEHEDSVTDDTASVESTLVDEEEQPRTSKEL